MKLLQQVGSIYIYAASLRPHHHVSGRCWYGDLGSHNLIFPDGIFPDENWDQESFFEAEQIDLQLLKIYETLHRMERKDRGRHNTRFIILLFLIYLFVWPLAALN